MTLFLPLPMSMSMLLLLVLVDAQRTHLKLALVDKSVVSCCFLVAVESSHDVFVGNHAVPVDSNNKSKSSHVMGLRCVRLTTLRVLLLVGKSVGMPYLPVPTYLPTDLPTYLPTYVWIDMT